VENKATSLRFHEGSHGEDYLNFVRANPFPVFTGKVGMKVVDFNKALKDYKEAQAAWSNDLNKVKLKADCVGKSIDEFHKGEKGYKKICS
jgi:hypothetical protein